MKIFKRISSGVLIIFMALSASLLFMSPEILFAHSKNRINMLENIKPDTSGTILVFDCFGVIFEDKFKSFIDVNKKTLQRFVETQNAPLKARELGFPDFYYRLAEQIDLNNITDREFYSIFSSASGHAPEVIKEAFNDVNCLNKNLVKILLHLKEKGYKVALFANADRVFLQKFLEVNIQNIQEINSNYQVVGDLFDLVRTSSDIRKNKRTPEMIKAISEYFDVPNKKLIVIDDSKENVEYFRKLGVNALHYQGDDDELLTVLSTLLGKGH